MTHYEEAIFAGGCFWCMVHPFDQEQGVQSIVSGYAGGHMVNPSYEDVVAGGTGHSEAVKITYDPKQISYDKLLEIYWSSMDPTDAEGQFYDRGEAYHPAIYYTTLEQRRKAEKSKKSLEKSGRFDRPIVVPIVEATTFYPAEEHHQDYYQKNPLHYEMYAKGSGRQDFIKKHQ